MKKISLFIISLFLLLQITEANDYPKTKLEKEMDEMGSLIGGDGIVFKPRKHKNTDTHARVGNVNTYLYNAAIDVLKFAPLASADSNSGIVITEWYSPKEQKDTQFKINVYIKDEIITPEAIEVVAFQRDKINGKWSEDYKPSEIAPILEDKIIRKARNLYLESTK
jgi:hypothetical protein